ncbi:nuclear pore complex protein NUP205-like [Durio zibethinus]|uniref:Nuclear pore complex protein NUP205-like n=1 Tax=Durio zibethinus TaxID=66656 RepID=A0A6P5ZII0_DURZI|nr:nuclear pore complex protein NUP205-like [Durio zibethinus]
MVGLVQLLLKSNTANSLVEDYAACLELRLQECQVIENSGDDPGILIMQLLIANISRPAPNITHLLLKFDLDTSIVRTLLQPKFHYSFNCYSLKVILEILENASKPDVNTLLHEFGFQLLFELCLDSLTCGPTMDLLRNKKYHFFVTHLDTIGVAPLPKRNSNQALRISSLHQKAWMLKLLAIELHAAYVSSPDHREACQSILAHLFGQDVVKTGTDIISQSLILQNSKEHAATRTISKTKVLELLEVVQFRSPDTTMKLSQIISNMKYDLLAEDILGNPTSGKGGIYYYSKRGDRLIDLASLRDKLWQKFNSVYPQLSNFASEAELNEVRETIQQLLRWGWRYNKNLEEQAAQLHMLTGWSRIIEVSVSRRISLLENRSEILYQILDASLCASASPDCSLKMAFILSQVSVTCMAKLRDDRFLCPVGFNSDNITCLDIIMVKQLSNGACHSMLFKLIMAILRNQSSEALRRRQYALLLSYFQYCQHMLALSVPTTVLQQLLLDEQDGEDLDLQKVIKDAAQGSEPRKTISLYVLDVGGGHSLDSLQRAFNLEAELALFLRISHRYGKSGARVLFSMGALEHIASCRAVNLQGSLRRVDKKLIRDVAVDIDKQQMIVTPVLRLVFSLTSLVDTSEFFEVLLLFLSYKVKSLPACNERQRKILTLKSGLATEFNK